MALRRPNLLLCSLPMLGRFTKNILPWLITAIALYYAFKGVDWAQLVSHLKNASPWLIFSALLVTCISYMLRARRWEYLFPEFVLSYGDSVRVLFLGFFMNNVLPARAGELVRAHAGAQVSGQKRTLVLATIFSERLADGLTLSLFFVAFAFSVGDRHLSENFSYVALAFAAITAGVVITLAFRRTLFHILEKFEGRFEGKASRYALSRVGIFIEGLSPLTNIRKLPFIILSSIVVWLVELSVFVIISQAYKSPLPLSSNVLFLVAVNFSSLIPAAPGGIGVIEAVTSVVLISLGIDKEQALAMVVTQHAIQYLVVGVPGALSLFSLKNRIQHIVPTKEDDAAEETQRTAQ